jgi:ubiquinone/menaquinone biosynthesis C-methylase UbiE
VGQNISPDQQHPLGSETIKGLPLAAASRWPHDSTWEFYRRAAISGARGLVLEIGVGAWLNLTRYSRDIKSLTGIEPNARSIKKAMQRAQQLGWDVDLRQGTFESLPFPDESFDTVVATFVWCSVSDVPAGLREIRRVLKPGGELRFLEHVRSQSPRAARVQDMMTPLWRRLAGNCHPNRDTEQAIRAAGFQIVESWHLYSDRSLPSPTVVGIAFRRS